MESNSGRKRNVLMVWPLFVLAGALGPSGTIAGCSSSAGFAEAEKPILAEPAPAESLSVAPVPAAQQPRPIVPVSVRPPEVRSAQLPVFTQPAGQADGAMPAAHHVHGKVYHAGEDSFHQQVLGSDVPVLVDFYADWCGPCKRLGPTLDEVARETPGAKVVKVNIEDSPRLAARYGVSSIPSLKVFKNGQVVAEHVGMASKSQLQTLLQR